MQTNGITSQFPKDYDAAVLTGFSAKPDGFAIAFAAANPAIASQNDPARFGDLAPGYLVEATKDSNQLFFFGNAFDPAILDAFEKTKGGQTVGEFLTQLSVKPATEFTGPLFVVNGENDLPNCAGDCSFPYDKTAAVQKELYPKAGKGSGYVVIPETGHALTLHYTAKKSNEDIVDFIRSVGF